MAQPSFRSFLQERRHDTARAHAQGASGFATAASLTRMYDEVVTGAFDAAAAALTARGRDFVAVFALGGYARTELSPASDVDVMVLAGEGVEKSDAESFAHGFLHALWDAGLNVGHSVRTMDEVYALFGHALDSWASMLESRFVCGSMTLADAFRKGMTKYIAPADPWFIEGLLADSASRHERFGNSVKLLEPNIKKSAGGLRDYHTLYWLLCATDASFFAAPSSDTPAAWRFVNELFTRGTISRPEYEQSLAAIQFLMRTRHEMHYLRQSLHDTLEYALQGEVAEGLGYGPKAAMRSVEVFMRDYYLHARTIHRLHTRLVRRFSVPLAFSGARREQGQPSGTQTRHDGSFFPEETADNLTAVQVLEAFVAMAEMDATPDAALQTAIESAAMKFGREHQESRQLADLFKRILAGRNVGRTLHLMSELGILGKYIPEFAELVAFFQHNVYHYYTADEHTLIAIANAEKLSEGQGILGEVFRSVPRKDILYLAILLHDIAKPRGVVDHEITGMAMSREILRRLHMEDLIPEITFLVRNHLVMEQVAFRRNVHDPETIREFSSLFDNPEQLDYLYLLTYADLSAVNTNVWTEWKALLLRELYQRTSEVLRRNLKGEDINLFHRQLRETSERELVENLDTAIPRDEVKRHLDGIQSAAYSSLFTEEEIARHIREGALNNAVSTSFAHREGYTEVTIIGRDAPFALSKFCAVLAANDANIFDATIFTREDGLLIDRFRVSDVGTHRQLEGRVCVKIESDILQVIEGTLDIEHLFQAHRRKWKRRPKLPSNPSVRQDVEFEDNPKYTIIDVYAPDALGLLYRITETISRLGLDIHFAKIATRMDGIVDAFYTLERDGTPVNDPDRRDRIRLEILKTIKAMGEQELA